MGWKEKAKSGLLAITMGCVIGSIPVGLGGIAYTTYKSCDALTAEAEEMRRLENDAELREKYPQINEVYLELKSDPEVIASKNKSDQEISNMFYWAGIAMVPMFTFGMVVMLSDLRHKRKY
ncbi:MAG: hypothetical protein WC852_04930 [Candidatus Nanoarchaeia archaeon]|jgi:hypothetical protein